VGDVTGAVLRLNSGGRHQMAHVTPFLGGGGGGGGVGVPSVRLDEVVASDPRSEVLMLKIDVEGHEVHALRGALGLLRRRVVRWVTMEAGEAARWARANTSAEDMVILHQPPTHTHRRAYAGDCMLRLTRVSGGAHHPRRA